MSRLPATYDTWKLQGPPEDTHPIGRHHGDTCNRVQEPDDDAPRGYRARPCRGVMMSNYDVKQCDICGEIA